MTEEQADCATARTRKSGSPVQIIWITGLSGVGKTTLASAVHSALDEQGIRAVLLDGDAVRQALDSPEQLARHDYASRLRRAWRLARCARSTAEQGLPVIVATISLIHAVQAWNRAGPVPYREVLIAADIDVLRHRNPLLYGRDSSNRTSNVVGLDIVPEFPLHPELVIEQRFHARDLDRHTTVVIALWRRIASQVKTSA